jgi:hypothetical protein
MVEKIFDEKKSEQIIQKLTAIFEQRERQSTVAAAECMTSYVLEMSV